MPAVEPCDALCLVLGRDGCLVERSVGRMFEGCALEALVIMHRAVADELHLRHARDRLEVWMEDGLFGRLGLVIPMPICFGGWVKCLWGCDIPGVSAYVVSDDGGGGVRADAV